MKGFGEFTYGDDGRPLRLSGVVMETTARKRAELALHDANEHLRLLSRRILEVQEAERRHLARELHDEMGQVLTMISVNLKSVKRRLDSAGQQELDESIGHVDRVIQDMRDLSLNLRPAMLDDLGLDSALRWQAKRQAERAGFQVDLVSDSTAVEVPVEVRNACYRVAQEALTNVVRHGKARRVGIELHQRDGEVELIIQDDGVGFNVNAARAHADRGKSLGLLSMKERVELLAGSFEIQSAPGRGTIIRARFPLLTSSGILS